MSHPALPVVIVALMMIAWGLSDWIMEDKQTQKNEALRQQMRLSLQEQYQTLEVEAVLEEAPILFYCVIRRSSGWNVTHCVTGAKIGQVVDVLQAGVGPNREYNLVRLRADPNDVNHPEVSMTADSIGWFPIRWLQKLDNYETMIQKQLRELETNKK